jgi:hypothetical protein
VQAERLGIGKTCPRCGARRDTLGSVCPACGKPYEPGGLLERLPLMNDGLMSPARSAEAFLLFLVLLAVGWVWLVVTHPVAGIIAAAAAFVLLVAAIGAANALTDRGR